MNPSQSKAASRPKMNKSLEKMFGAPHDVTHCTGGDISGSTAASKRSDVNGTISGKHFFEGPNDYGHTAVGGS